MKKIFLFSACALTLAACGGSGSNVDSDPNVLMHTDFERGFICAETISYNDFIQLGSEGKAKESGKMRQEGKAYVVVDGDVMHFRFNV